MPNSLVLFYTEHQGIIQIIVAIITLYVAILGPIFQYTIALKKKNQVKRFKSYHDLIDKLVGATGPTMLDRQIVIIYELRNFPDYYKVTERILKALKIQWNNDRISSEIDITLEYIESNCFKKRFCFKK